jgi:hypothetical protein
MPPLKLPLWREFSFGGWYGMALGALLTISLGLHSAPVMLSFAKSCQYSAELGQ